MQPRDRDHEGPGRRPAVTMSDSTSDRATRDRPDAYIPRDRRWALHHGHALPDRVRGSALFADISGFTPAHRGPGEGARAPARRRGADGEHRTRLPRGHRRAGRVRRQRHLLRRRRDHLLDRWRRRHPGLRRRDGHAGGHRADGHDRHPGGCRGPARDEGRGRRGRGAAVRGWRPGHPAHRRPRRAPHGRPRRGRASRREGRDRARRSRPWRLWASHHARRPPHRRDQRPDLRASSVACSIDVEPEPGHQPAPLPEDLVRPWLLPAVYERHADRPRRVPGRAPAGHPGLPPLRRHRLRPRRRRDREAGRVRPRAHSGS